MAIMLFSHNLAAYEAAVSMLEQTGKAAIIHPTGTGKSFIAFKLCEEHPGSTVFWLSPSEYILKTQFENLSATGATIPDNITFCTYAKLMNMSPAELSELHPGYIVLDEFHRCGAKMWGQGVQHLLDLCPRTPILGLSATNIRYLDNQRDMADELFDGNIASEMTLGEAIARGILAAPKYVISVYSYQKELNKYQQRVRHAKSKAVQHSAQVYLDALRRALAKADGLDEIFNKHMTDRSGKYLVFCAGIEQMNDLLKRSPEWFSKVDTAPHIYTAYSDNPETSCAFAEFKADASEHLKLLFCIDMLNEGVHVENISGVILFRPTVSPIIYKQQIGRALSATKATEPVIFDIVNNFENLYSISTIEDEINQAVEQYRRLGNTDEIIREHFDVIDEVRDCAQLFDELNDTLTASWDLMYMQAKSYYDEHKNLEVPKRYKTPSGYSLGHWILTQRQVHAGERYGKLNGARIRKLDEIGMIWGGMREYTWERNYAHAKRYYDEHGNLDVAANYTTPDGVKLGAWISQLRTNQQGRVPCTQLTTERVALLNAIGMIWNVPNHLWEQNYSAAAKYFSEYGNLDVPLEFVSDTGLRLGAWIRRIRGIRAGSAKGAELTASQIERLDAIGMLWEDKYTRQWEAGFQEATTYYYTYGHLNVAPSYCSPSGFKLGAWIANHRDPGGTRITPERKARLDSIGMVWEKDNPWEVRYIHAKRYYLEHGDLRVPADFVSDGIWLSKWLNEQKQIYHGKRSGKHLTPDQISKLEAIGFDWLSISQRIWEDRYADALKVYLSTGNVTHAEGLVSNTTVYLRWLNAQRRAFREGKLSQDQIRRLNELAFPWKAR